MKTFKKVLASALAAAMVVTAFPVTNAEAASTAKLNKTKATVYAGQSTTLKVTTPKTWKNVKVKASKKGAAAKITKVSGKKVTVKAVKAGTAKVTVKVTAKKAGKKVSKTLKATITVKNPSLTLKAANVVAVGATEQITATVKPTNTKVAFTSSDETIAKVDEKGVVTGVKAGKVTITATAGKTTKTVDMEVKTAIFKSVAQASTKTLTATFAGNTKALKATDFKITNTSNNVVYAVKDVTVDAKDATKVTLTTYMEMKDAKEYTVEYDGTTQKFTATDGVVVTLGLDKTQIDAATETEIQAQTKDANGVVIDSYKYGDAKVTMTVNVTNGYMTGASKLYLNKAGDTATVDLTYHKGTFDTTGKEEVIEQKGITVTAVDPEKVTVAGWAVKIGDAGKTFDKVTETKIAVGDSKTAYVQVTNSKNKKSVDLSAYTVESSNNDALIVSATTAQLKKGEISLIAVKEGTSYILVKDAKTGAVVTTLAVTVSAARKASSIELDKTAVTLSSTIKEKAAVKVTVKDQYGEKLAIEKKTVETLSYTDAKGNTSKPASDPFKSAKFADDAYTFEADGVATGKYVVKVSANGLSRTVNIEVVEVSKDATTSYAFDMSASKADATITADTEKDATITATIYQLKGGVKNAVIKDVTATLKKADGTDAAIAPAVNDGVVTVAANKLSDGSKLEAGTYTLTVTPIDTKNVPTFTRNIVITDSQTAATFKRVSESGKTIDSCFEFYLNGEKITTTETPVFYYGDKEITKPEGATPVTKAIITYKLGKNTVKQTVNIGLTVTITK